MYALIEDDYDPTKRQKQVMSAHKSREAAQKALEKHRIEVQKRVWECIHRIVWIEGQIRRGDRITPDAFETWGPHEEIPEGDRVPDGD